MFRLRTTAMGATQNISTNLLTTSYFRIGMKVLWQQSVHFFPVLVFGLLLCTVFPFAQISWSFDLMCGSTGDTGSEQACGFSDAGAATDSEDDSPQDMPGDCVVSRVSVSDCESSSSLASMNEMPPSTFLVSRLLHPPTAHS